MKRYMNAIKTGIVLGNLSLLFFSFLAGKGELLMYNSYTVMGQYYHQHSNEATIMVIMLCGWGSIGILFEVAGRLFNKIDSLITGTLVHFVITLTGLFTLGYLLGWFDLRVDMIISFTLEFFIMYLIVYYINYKIMKRNIKLLNNAIHQKE